MNSHTFYSIKFSVRNIIITKQNSKPYQDSQKCKGIFLCSLLQGTCFGGAGLEDLQSSLPTPTTLWISREYEYTKYSQISGKKEKNHKGSRPALLWQPWSSAPQPSSQRDGQTLLSHGFGHSRKFQYKDSAKRSNMTTHYINHCFPRILSPAAFLYMNTHSIIC